MYTVYAARVGQYLKNHHDYRIGNYHDIQYYLDRCNEVNTCSFNIC